MSEPRTQSCLFCGGDASAPGHRATCDGRQGRREAFTFDAAPLPMLAAGLTEDTYQTSIGAAVSIEPDRASQRMQVLEAIRAAGPLGRTDDEIQQRLGLDGSSERPRRWELWKLDLICARRDEHGAVVRRETRTHRRAVVWVVPAAERRRA